MSLALRVHRGKMPGAPNATGDSISVAMHKSFQPSARSKL
jgi:hypothetical protein